MELNLQCKQVMKAANQIGKSLGATVLDSQHLLYGLAKCTDSVAGAVLASHKITPAAIKKSVETRTKPLTKVKKSGKLELTPQVRKLLDSAEKIARDTGAVEVGTEHILYAILTEEKCLAYNLLNYFLREFKYV